MKEKKVSRFDKWFWYVMYFFLFGYSCLGIPGGAGLRPVICACVIGFSALTYIRCVILNYHVGLASFVVMITVLAIILGMSNGGTITGLVLDTTVCSSVLLGIYMMRFQPIVIKKFLIISAVCSLLVFVICYRFNSFGMDDIVSRGAIDTEAFAGSAMLWPMALTVAYVTVFKGDINKYYFYLGYAYWAVCIVIHLMFLKRAIITDSIFLLLGIMWYYQWCQKKNVFSTAFKLIITTAFVVFITNAVFEDLLNFDITAIIDRMGERFEQTETGTVRIDESENYFKNASTFDIIVGKGLGVAHHGLGFEKKNTALHIGINNLVLKHGVFMVMMYIIMVVSIFYKILRRPNLTKMQQVCAITFLSSFPPFVFYGNFWATAPAYCFMWYSIFYIFFRQKENIT